MPGEAAKDYFSLYSDQAYNCTSYVAEGQSLSKEEWIQKLGELSSQKDIILKG